MEKTKGRVGVTFEQVAAAADGLLAKGINPASRTVREVVGTGSLGTVQRHLAVWDAGRRKAEVAPVTLPKEVHESVVNAIALAVTEARAGLESGLASAKDDLVALGDECEQQAGRIDELEATLDSVHAENQKLSGRIVQLESDAEVVKTDAASAVQAAEEKTKQETAGREAAQIALATAELQLKSLPKLDSEIRELRNGLDTERSGRTNAERDMASEKSRADGLSARLSDTQALVKKLEADLSEVRNSLASKTEFLGQQAGTIAALEKRILELQKQMAEGAKVEKLKHGRSRKPDVQIEGVPA